jgi:hypothetical protein
MNTGGLLLVAAAKRSLLVAAIWTGLPAVSVSTTRRLGAQPFHDRSNEQQAKRAVRPATRDQRPATTTHQPSPALYRATLIQAAPGRLVELIDLLKARAAVYDAAGEARPYVMRHSQGDHWDLMVLEPLGASMSEYFAAPRVKRRADAAQRSGLSEDDFERRLQELVSWREETFARGPSPEVAAARFGAAGFAHIEMFVALAGKRAELLKEREMENRFLEGIGRQGNLLFVREGGAAWDSFSIGLYRDLKHYAENADVPADKAEASAKAAGFDSRGAIGPYLRQFVGTHHDTLAGVVR